MVSYIRWIGKNYGDELNEILFRQKLGINQFIGHTDQLSDDLYVLGIGTILNGHLKQGKSSRLVIFGSGAGYTSQKPKIRAEVLFVRGPLTCDYLGINKRKFISDGAYALHSEILEQASGQRKEHDYGLVPHHWSIENCGDRWHANEFAHLISPHLGFSNFVQEVAKCRKIVTECLHAAITADILHLPFSIVQTTPVFHSFKWLDWAESLGLDLTLQYFDTTDFLESTFSNLFFTNSKLAIKNSVIERIDEKVDALKSIIRKAG